MAPRPARLVALTALALATAPVLVSCSAVQFAFGSTKSAAYSGIDDFRADTTLPAPPWVPDDATAIRYTIDVADGSSIVTFQSPSHFTSGTCEADAQRSVAAEAGEIQAPLQDSWWPETLPAALFTCDTGWTAFVDGDAVYGFLPAGSESDGLGAAPLDATAGP
ncbi:hypothetical protein ELQ90_11285 [Labedella phragmitis]|uniref:Uncharacterized protein n=1 Tax=Labedella phragmitis TaxID=2498849 RepID=A0A3S4AJH4_9MICO|nr:hypothetical protein [Labedella phragmitis]RWZ49924.1 hypothetical protein ELQ90_11285 [Labedella phragmitis]